VILHRDGAFRREQPGPAPASVPELARLLRSTRQARNLDLAQASAQSGIPVDQLEGLESGTVSRLPDRVSTLKSLQRYGDMLGLPGDKLVVTLIEHWPLESTARPPVVVVHGVGAPATPFASVPSSAVATTASELPTGGLAVVGSPTAVTQTALGPTTEQVPSVFPDTGVTPAVGRAAPTFATTALRSLVVVVTLLLVVGTAWLSVNAWHPQWLADLHLPYTSHGAGSSELASSSASTSQTSAPSNQVTTTAPHHSAPKKAVTTADSLQVVSTTPTTATLSVGSATFTVHISAEGGATWVSVSDPTSETPTFEGVLQSGEDHDVLASQQVTIQIGSSAARIAVTVGSRQVGTYTPPSAPYTMTFTSS
jgi:hypothetical protein